MTDFESEFEQSRFQSRCLRLCAMDDSTVISVCDELPNPKVLAIIKQDYGDW